MPGSVQYLPGFNGGGHGFSKNEAVRPNVHYSNLRQRSPQVGEVPFQKELSNPLSTHSDPLSTLPLGQVGGEELVEGPEEPSKGRFDMGKEWRPPTMVEVYPGHQPCSGWDKGKLPVQEESYRQEGVRPTNLFGGKDEG